MPVARAMRAAAANQIMMLAVNPLSSVCTNVHRDQYCTTRIEFLVILSFTHFYGRAAAELSFSDLVLGTFTGTLKTVFAFNSFSLYLYREALGRGSLGLMSRSDGLMSRPGPKTRNPGHKPQK